MIGAKFLREHHKEVLKSMAVRNHDPKPVEQWLDKDKRYREILQETESMKAERNKINPKGKPEPSLLAKLKVLSAAIKHNDETVKQLESELNAIIMEIPNMVQKDTPSGTSDENNPVLKTWGKVPDFKFTPQSHDELGRSLDILDFERGVKLSGSRFTVYKGMGARLERALINFMLDQHMERGYTEILPPFMVNRESMTGTGQLPKFEEDSYRCEPDDLFLIPTAEVPVTNLYRDEIIDIEELPMKFAAYTPCFRREAGSYGKDISGLIRQHQFNKVELVMYTAPEQSEGMLEQLTCDAEHILEALKLPYRRVRLCGGDLGFSSSKTYDLEVWFPAQGLYREISSCSNFLDFQARRAMIRYRKDKEVEYLHTLNGSGLAVGRTLAAILENYQQADGSIKVPDVLHNYLKTEIISKTS